MFSRIVKHSGRSVGFEFQLRRFASTTAIQIDPVITEMHNEMTEWRRDFHRHPELGFEEVRTAGIVADKLESWGLDVTRNVGITGVVGTLYGRQGPIENPSTQTGLKGLALRADMDALPMQEENDFAHKSTIPGKAHLCGHDGHTSILLGVAKYLSGNTDCFEGQVHFVFQPGEEGYAGARKMIKEGLFERFPCDEVYGIHNWPMMPVGTINVSDGPIMASADEFDLTITGVGGHAAMPHLTRDPIMLGSKIVEAVQTIVSRRVNPLSPAVVSITTFNGGTAHNVIPESVQLGGTFRTFDEATRKSIPEWLHQIISKTVEAHGEEFKFKLKIHEGYPVTSNNTEQAAYARAAAVATVGEENVTSDHEPSMGAEDFSFMLHEKPGCYAWVGGGVSGASLHHPQYDFNDEVLPIACQFFSNIVATRLAPTAQ